MPKLSEDRDLIRSLSLEREVDELVTSGLKDSRVIAKRLNEEPTIAPRLRGKKVYPFDVDFYLAGTSALVAQQKHRAIAESPEVKQTAIALQNGMNKLLIFMDKSGLIADQVIMDFDSERKKYMGQEPVRGPQGAMVLLYEYPHKHVASLEKAVRIIKTTVDAVKNDSTVQQILKAGVVNVQSGYSDEQLFEEIVRVCERLGHSRADALRAWAESKAVQTPIDVPHHED